MFHSNAFDSYCNLLLFQPKLPHKFYMNGVYEVLIDIDIDEGN